MVSDDQMSKVDDNLEVTGSILYHLVFSKFSENYIYYFAVYNN